MKTSYQILLSAAGVALMILLTNLLVLRNDLKSLQLKKYKTTLVERFIGVDFSSHWVVNIKQGREYKVELWTQDSTVLKTTLENRGGTLYFIAEPSSRDSTTKTSHVRITAPSLQSIKTAKGTKVHIQDFMSYTDSLNVVLENGASFSGKNNHFRNVSFKVAGDAWLKYQNGEESAVME